MKKQILCAACSLFLFPLLLFSVPERIVLGKEDRWGAALSKEGVVFKEGKGGYLDVYLDDSPEDPGDVKGDLFIPFESTPPQDQLGNYTVLESSVETTTEIVKRGERSGIFRERKRDFILRPEEGSLFSPQGEWGDFTIQFWLYPSTLEDGEDLFLWIGRDIRDGQVVPQELRCSIRNRRIEWVFTNFFYSPATEKTTIQVDGLSTLIPRSWSHHLLRFDSATGMLEYTVNGVPDGITYASQSGEEDGTILYPRLGQNSAGKIVIGAGYTGAMDNVSITREFLADPELTRYGGKQGSLVTTLFDLEYSNSKLKEVNADYALPGETEMYFYYRLGEEKTGRNSVNAPWEPFTPGNSLEDARGRYLQILVELLPDGSGELSPRLSTLTLVYEQDLPPPPPRSVRAIAGNGEVKLIWKSVLEADIKGYMVYYGSRPGRYNGTDAEGGPSPLDVGALTSVTIDGLENGRLYYFTVVAYDASSPPHFSVFSEEVSARPSQFQEISKNGN